MINEQGPRTGTQEPLLWDPTAWSYPVLGICIHRRWSCMSKFDWSSFATVAGSDERCARLRPCADMTWTTLQSCRPVLEAAPRLKSFRLTNYLVSLRLARSREYSAWRCTERPFSSIRRTAMRGLCLWPNGSPMLTYSTASMPAQSGTRRPERRRICNHGDLCCRRYRFDSRFQRTLFSCASGTRPRPSQRTQIGMAAAAKRKLGPELVPQL
ncbi:hypothetical protein M3J09_000378 [Ascochyta lentis]